MLSVIYLFRFILECLRVQVFFSKIAQLHLARVFENEESGFYVHRVEAVDLDARPKLRYSIDALNSEARNEEGVIVKVKGKSFSFLGKVQISVKLRKREII